MDTYEKLLDNAENNGLQVLNRPFSSKIKGLYCNNVIAINTVLETSTEKACILAEELGHYHTSTGNIIDQSVVENRKQEYRARAWAYNKMVGLTGIIDAHKHHCCSLQETAEHLNVPIPYLKEVLLYYKSKYGTHVSLDNYVIYFDPSVGVLELMR